MKPKTCVLFTSLITVALATSLGVHAATETWTTGSGTANWSTAANWTGTNTPPISGDSLIFGATTGATTLNNDLTLTSLGTITFTAAAPAYTISGNGINTGGAFNTGSVAGIVVNSASGVTQTLSLNLTMTSTTTSVTGAGDLVFTGSIIRNGATVGMAMNGTGTLTLSGSSNYAGIATNTQFTANSGTVILAKTGTAFNPSGVTGGLYINGSTVKQGVANQINNAFVNMTGGTFDLAGFDVGSAGSTTVGMNLKGTGGTIVNNGGNASLTNTLNLIPTSSNFSGGSAYAYGGKITDGTSKLALAVGGAAANWFQALAGNNTYSGGIRINGAQSGRLSITSLQNIGTAGSRNLTFNGTGAGVLQITGNQLTSDTGLNLTFATGRNSGFDIADSTNTFTLATAVNSGTSGVFSKQGAGTLVLTGAATHTGATNVQGGTLRVDYATGSMASTTALNLSGGGSLSLLGNSSGTTTQSVASTTLSNSNGGGKIVVDANGGSGTTLNLLGLGGVGVSNIGVTLDIKLIGANNTVTTTTSAATNGLYGGGRMTFRDNSGNIDLATNTTVGGNQTIGAATYTAGLLSSGATATVNYSQTDNATVTSSEQISALKLTTSTTGQSLDITSNETLTANAILFTGADAYSITGGMLKSALGSTSDLVIHQYGAGALTIGSVIASNLGASTLTKAGTGTLVLSGTNTFTGQTYVNGGTLSISANNQLGAVATGAALNLNGGGTLQSTVSVTLDNAGSNKRAITIGSGGGGFDVTSTNTLTVTGAITATGELKKSGTGTLLLSVANNLTGGVRIEAGTVKLGATGALNAYNSSNAYESPTSALAFGAGAAPTLALNGFNAQILGLTSANTAAVIKSGSASAGTDTLTVMNGGDNTYVGTLVNGGTRILALTKSGGGTLTLSNTNTYTGATAISNGKLTISSTGTINGTSGVAIAGGEFNYNSSTALTQAITFSGTGGKLSGSGTINQAVSVTAGNTLAIGNSVGQMNFGSTLGLAGTDLVEIDGTAGAGLTGGHDFANVTGAITYGGALTLDMGVIFSTGSYTWNLFDFAGADLGTFSTITLSDQYSGSLLDGDLNGVWDLTSGDNTWQFTESTGVLGLTVVPEPNVTALIGGLGGLCLLRRRRTAQ